MASASQILVAKEDVFAFVVRCMRACQAPVEHAEALADLLVTADYRGHFSHGILVLAHYVDSVKQKGIAISGSPQVLKETVATALVDGQNLLGPFIGRFCMDLAIEKAKSVGIGMVSARGCTHFGITGWYGLRATEQGMLGMAFTNSNAFLVPTRAKAGALGTNPICAAAPAKNGDNFVLDMATTTVAAGKIKLAEIKNQDIPKGWALSEDGTLVTDPKQFKRLPPLGVEEKTSGYKGYGLSMMVEVLCGILSGANYGPHIPLDSGVPNLGQCFIAINPATFADGFTERMSDLMSFCRNLEPTEGEEAVLVAGDRARKHMNKCDRQGGIAYHPNIVQSANDIAASLKINPLKAM